MLLVKFILSVTVSGDLVWLKMPTKPKQKIKLTSDSESVPYSLDCGDIGSVDSRSLIHWHDDNINELYGEVNWSWYAVNFDFYWRPF